MSINKVILIGNLGRDPELRYSQSGGAICSFNLATTRKWKDRDSTLQEETEWHKVSVFGKIGEACGEHLAKGRQVYVEGRIKTRQYDDKDGVKRYSTEVIAENVTFLGGGSGDGGRGDRSHGGRSSGRSRSREPGDDYDPGEYSSKQVDDDLPF